MADEVRDVRRDGRRRRRFSLEYRRRRHARQGGVRRVWRRGAGRPQQISLAKLTNALRIFTSNAFLYEHPPCFKPHSILRRGERCLPGPFPATRSTRVLSPRVSSDMAWHPMTCVRSVWHGARGGGAAAAGRGDSAPPGHRTPVRRPGRGGWLRPSTRPTLTPRTDTRGEGGGVVQRTSTRPTLTPRTATGGGAGVYREQALDRRLIDHRVHEHSARR